MRQGRGTNLLFIHADIIRNLSHSKIGFYGPGRKFPVLGEFGQICVKFIWNKCGHCIVPLSRYTFIGRKLLLNIIIKEHTDRWQKSYKIIPLC